MEAKTARLPQYPKACQTAGRCPSRNLSKRRSPQRQHQVLSDVCWKFDDWKGTPVRYTSDSSWREGRGGGHPSQSCMTSVLSAVMASCSPSRRRPSSASTSSAHRTPHPVATDPIAMTLRSPPRVHHPATLATLCSQVLPTCRARASDVRSAVWYPEVRGKAAGAGRQGRQNGGGWKYEAPGGSLGGPEDFACIMGALTLSLTALHPSLCVGWVCWAGWWELAQRIVCCEVLVRQSHRTNITRASMVILI